MNHVVCGGLTWSSKCEPACYMTFAHGEVMKAGGWGWERPQNRAGITERLTTAKQTADGEHGTPSASGAAQGLLAMSGTHGTWGTEALV